MRYFCILLMKPAGYKYNTRHILSSVMMIMTLAWLTVSLPLVTKYQQATIAVKTSSNGDDSKKKDNSNPFASTTEEKNPGSSNTIAEEFLHESCFHSIDQANGAIFELF